MTRGEEMKKRVKNKDNEREDNKDESEKCSSDTTPEKLSKGKKTVTNGIKESEKMFVELEEKHMEFEE